MTDEIEKSLRGLRGDSPAIEPRVDLSLEERQVLIAAVGGPRTARSIRRAMKSYTRERIPFLFSSLEPQLVADIMANDVDELIASAIAVGQGKKSR